ncbi:membrane associated protein [Cryptosporidium xiaoi]|uniref:Membrane associated protein n=1 Tax=Cryptosporidium xiaoi TaxID=659607 RepID=A0AAV9XVH5_9CRYT
MAFYKCKILNSIIFVTYFILLFESVLSNSDSKENGENLIRTIYDLNKKDILSLIVIGLIGSIAVSVGGGAGIISMPIFLSLMRIPFSQAVSFSSSIILGGIICALSANVFQKKCEFPEYLDAIEFLKIKLKEYNENEYKTSIKPINDTSLIDIQFVLFIAPLLTDGSLIGMAIARTIPDTLSMFILICLLSYALKSSITRFINLRKLESNSSRNQLKEFKSNYNKNEENFKAILYLYTTSVISFKYIQNFSDYPFINKEELIFFENQEYSNLKYWVYFTILCLISISISFIDSGIFFKRGTIAYYVFKILCIFILLLFPVIVLPKQKLNLISSIINSENRLIKVYNRIFKNKELEFQQIDIISYIFSKTHCNTVNYFLSSFELFSVGVIGGITGASGGILISTILFTSQIDSSSIAANNSTCLLVSTLICFLTYLFEGRIMIDLALLIIFISIICTLIGKNVIDYYVKKYKMSSILTSILILLISSSLIYIGQKVVRNSLFIR